MNDTLRWQESGQGRGEDRRAVAVRHRVFLANRDVSPDGIDSAEDKRNILCDNAPRLMYRGL